MEDADGFNFAPKLCHNGVLGSILIAFLNRIFTTTKNFLTKCKGPIIFLPPCHNAIDLA